MATVIRQTAARGRSQGLPDRLLSLLPPRLGQELRQIAPHCGRIEELRLRCGRRASLTVEGGNLLLETALSRQEMDDLVLRLCDGALYAHRETIVRGYLSLPDGIRVGICGRAAVEGETVLGIYDVSSLCVRLPARIGQVGAPVARLLRERGEGVLVYAPPAGGKTTLLRSVAASLASGERPLRVAVIDTRGELGFSLESASLCLDVLSGYPRPLGVEIVTRTMNPQLIVCDELGEIAEAEAIVAAENCGVPFLASAHGGSLLSLLRRTGIRRLHEAGVFGHYVGLRRPAGGGEFHYTVNTWREADELLQTGGRTAPGSVGGGRRASDESPCGGGA